MQHDAIARLSTMFYRSANIIESHLMGSITYGMVVADSASSDRQAYQANAKMPHADAMYDGHIQSGRVLVGNGRCIGSIDE